MNPMDRILERVEYLPPFPATVARALSMLRDPQVSAEDIADVVKYDQSVATNLLRFCNSSYVGLRRPISNIREAVVFIGLRHLKKILTITGARPFFEHRNSGYESRAGELWGHSLAVTVVAERIADMVEDVDRDRVFLASLLHDIGKLVMNEFIGPEYLLPGDSAVPVECSFPETERKFLGIDHALIGARILSQWRFPDDVAAAVGKHHEPCREGDSPLDDVVRLSDVLAISLGYGTAVDGLAYRGHAEVCRRRGIERAMLDAAMAASLEDIRTIQAEFGIAEEE